MKQRIRLTEADLHRIVKESVNKVLNESKEDAWNELRKAKATGDIKRILSALHNLENELRAEGSLINGHLKDGSGSWSSTPKSTFTGKYDDKGEYHLDPRFIVDEP